MTDRNTFVCLQCGQCCVNNGFLPPYTDNDKIEKPEWFDAFRQAVLDFVPLEAFESLPCMFLHDKKCLVHDHKPGVCQAFGGEDCCLQNNRKGDSK